MQPMEDLKRDFPLVLKNKHPVNFPRHALLQHPFLENHVSEKPAPETLKSPSVMARAPCRCLAVCVETSLSVCRWETPQSELYSQVENMWRFALVRGLPGQIIS